MITPELRIEIVEYARTWLGTKWRHQGRSKQGIDCIGLIIRTAEEFGFQYEDSTGYARGTKLDFIHFGYGGLSINALGFDSLPGFFNVGCLTRY